MLNGDALIASSTAPTLHDVIIDDVRGCVATKWLPDLRNSNIFAKNV